MAPQIHPMMVSLMALTIVIYSTRNNKSCK